MVFLEVQVMRATGSLPFVKNAAMNAAGELLLRSAAYRAAIAATKAVLAHLSRFVIYNGGKRIRAALGRGPTGAGTGRGVRSIELDGQSLPNNPVPLSDDGKNHNVSVELG